MYNSIPPKNTTTSTIHAHPSLAPYVCVIGGVNIDIQGYAYNTLNLHDSNPGYVHRSLGGVGRNIAENLVRLGKSTKFMSIIGDDYFGRQFIEHSAAIGLDISNCIVLPDATTSSYLSVLNTHKEMVVAIASMDILDEFTADYLHAKRAFIEDAELCVLDTNLPLSTLKFITENFKQKFFIDAVSVSKAAKIKSIVGLLHTIKTNLLELNAITDFDTAMPQAKSNLASTPETELAETELAEATACVFNLAKNFKNNQLQHIFVTLGSQGMYYNDSRKQGLLRAKKINPVSVTGVGDACMAALVYGHLEGWDLATRADFAQHAAMLTLMHEDAIHPELSVHKIKTLQEEAAC